MASVFSARDEARVLATTRRWLERAVIGLPLCPFAKAVHVKGQIRSIVSAAETPEALLEDLERELRALIAADAESVDTTLLIHPHALADFLDFNDFLAVADRALVELGLEGQLQIASFHPDYCFADSEPSDPANNSNRAPYPILHLLREASVSRALEGFPAPDSIYQENIARLRALGTDGWRRLLADPD